MKSAELFADLPSGKEWLRYDVNKARGHGPNFKAVIGQSPADVLKTASADEGFRKTVGTETIDGVETTHYRAAIDPRKIPRTDRLQALTKAVYKPVDVWVDEDGLVRQVGSTTRPTSIPRRAARTFRLTMKLAEFGPTVDVEPPAADLVVDATAPGQPG